MGIENKCALGMCPEHPHTLERLAMLEKGMSSVETSMLEVVERLTATRDMTMAEFKQIRENLIAEVARRQSPWVTIGFSLLFGVCCTLATILVEHLLD